MADIATQQKHPHVGRPTKLTPELLSKLRTAFMIGCTEEEACAFAEISEVSLWRYKERNPEFCNQIHAWRLKPILKARMTLFNKLDKAENARWLLERKRKDEFGTRQEIELTGNEDKPLFYLPDNDRDKHTE